MMKTGRNQSIEESFVDFQHDAFSAKRDFARSVFYTSARKLFHHVFSVLTPFIMNLHIL